MNAEEEPTPEMPEGLKKALQNFGDILKRKLSETPHIRVEGTTPQSGKTPFSMMPKGAAEMSPAAIDGIVHDTMPRVLNRTGVRVTLFTRYTDTPVLTSNEALIKLLAPSWKLHTFNHRVTRMQGDALRMVPGDKVVVVSPNAYSVSVLSYYVTGTQGMPDDDDYKVVCAFAGGCSLEPDLLVQFEVQKLRSILESSLFDAALVAPPVTDPLQDLLNDPEFQLIQDLLE